MSWQSALTTRLGIDHPIIQAPMAGGTTTPALVAAVSNAGALGAIGGGYMAADDLAAAIAETQTATDRPFAVNLFIPQPFQIDNTRIEQANARLNMFRSELGIERPAAPRRYAQPFADQFDAVLEAGVAVFSSTFGQLERTRIQALQQRGTCVMGTATTVAEAQALAEDGVDMIVAQGSDAGGHRGSFLASAEQSMIGTLSLVPQIVDRVDVPVIASGGVMDGRGMAACRILGAAGVQMGSAFLTCAESGAKPAHKQALLESAERPTSVTRAFSGKAARGLTNRFIQHMAPIESALPDYPVLNAWTKDIRAAAGQADRDEFMSLWAGQAASLARAMSAGELVDTLMREYDACF
ncbi:nitropropane dioxygenase [Salinisphaera sp. S4-8]|uniref:NAD(P)H-dependent flavin oxidoreductase n=1 Tax=Salinisphaera sp. S4-8 TaxID=633357 RepID=UPI003341F0FD